MRLAKAVGTDKVTTHCEWIHSPRGRAGSGGPHGEQPCGRASLHSCPLGKQR